MKKDVHYVQRIMRDQNISIRVPPQFRDKLADLRRAEPDLPTQTKMLERLVDRAHEALAKEAAE